MTTHWRRDEIRENGAKKGCSHEITILVVLRHLVASEFLELPCCHEIFWDLEGDKTGIYTRRGHRSDVFM